MIAPPGAILVLASASERRLELLHRIGFAPAEIDAPDIDETPARGELPRHTCKRLAREKLDATMARRGPGPHPVFVLAADTVAYTGRHILDKPAGPAEARAALRKLSGRSHRVCTSVALAAPDGTVGQRTTEARVRFKRLCEDEIAEYVRSGEWRGRAGAYTIGGHAGRFVRSVNGSPSTVEGLPLCETHALLTGAGYRPSSHERAIGRSDS